MSRIVFQPPIDGFQHLQDDALNYYSIASGETVCIPANTEYILTEDMILAGDIEAIGVLTLLDLDEMQRLHVLTTTADVTLTNGNDVVLCDATSNTVTVTLPAIAVSYGKVFDIKNIEASNAVTVDANASETIDGELTQTIDLNDSMKIVGGTTQWRII